MSFCSALFLAAASFFYFFVKGGVASLKNSSGLISLVLGCFGSPILVIFVTVT